MLHGFLNVAVFLQIIAAMVNGRQGCARLTQGNRSFTNHKRKRQVTISSDCCRMGNKQNGPVSSVDLSNGRTETRNTGENVGNRPRTISGGLQRRLSNAQGRPVFNMKIIVRGARGTGKTMLLRRLTNKPFQIEYKPTAEIDVVNVSWSYKVTDELIKLEAWEIVDKAIVDRKELYSPTNVTQNDESMIDKIRRSVTSPTASWESTKTKTGSHRVGALDASLVDVYKSTSAVCFLVDPRKPDTLDYVVKEVSNVPSEVMCVVLINFKDTVHNKPTNVKIHQSDLQRLGFAAQHLDIVVFECCLKDCYGLKTLHNYLNLPFLALKEKAIAEKLRRIQEERLYAKQEINTYIQESDYVNHLDYLNATSPKLTARQELNRSLAMQGQGINASASDTSNDQEISKLNLSEHVSTDVSGRSDHHDDNTAVLDKFFADNEEDMANLDNFFGQKSAFVKHEEYHIGSEENAQMDETLGTTDAVLDHNSQSVVTNNPFLDEAQAEVAAGGDPLPISEMQSSAAYQTNKIIADGVEESVDADNSDIHEDFMKSKTNGLSDAAKAAIANATKFDVLHNGEDVADPSLNDELEDDAGSFDQKKNKKSKKKKKKKEKKAKKEKKGGKKEKKKKKNRDATSSDSDFDDGNL